MGREVGGMVRVDPPTQQLGEFWPFSTRSPAGSMAARMARLNAGSYTVDMEVLTRFPHAKADNPWYSCGVDSGHQREAEVLGLALWVEADGAARPASRTWRAQQRGCGSDPDRAGRAHGSGKGLLASEKSPLRTERRTDDHARLRDRLATSNLRLSVVIEDSTSGCAMPAALDLGGVVHGRARAQLAQRMLYKLSPSPTTVIRV
ncbi:hypothetical protein [Pseudomonas brassicacearum]|uniref:hypothetical protein n=1 Tax=Pseudomonas brassicacearum TaxID=930166 RepID=UPI001F23241E|nr:hypothetical protein [Pseudomonas brassicacearum]